MHAPLIDSHAHIDVDAFDSDRDAVLARARAAGVDSLIVPAISAAGWPRLRDLCAGEPSLHPAYGLHPMFLGEHQPEHLKQLERWLQDERMVAVGECGLDFYVDGFDADQQRRYFRRQLELAHAASLPVIVHARRAVEEVIHTIRAVRPPGGVIHSFSGSTEQARQLDDLGFLVGLGGPVTYPRAQRLRRLASSLPLHQLLLETDAPDQPDAGWRGQRNEPARLPLIAAEIAQLRQVDIATIASATRDNARRLFHLA